MKLPPQHRLLELAEARSDVEDVDVFLRHPHHTGAVASHATKVEVVTLRIFIPDIVVLLGDP